MDLLKSGLLAGAAGLAVAFAASQVTAGRAEAETVAGLTARIDLLPGRRKDPAAPTMSHLVSAPPLFPVLSGPHALPEPVIRLEGVARSPVRTAALVSVNNAAAAWMTAGETRDGITLEEIGSDSIAIETPRGTRIVRLGEGAPAAAPTPPGAARPPPGVAEVNEMPPGVPAPPEPASAPGTQP